MFLTFFPYHLATKSHHQALPTIKLNLSGFLHTLRSTLHGVAKSLDHLVPDAALFLATECCRCEALRSAAMVLLKARCANFSPPSCEKLPLGKFTSNFLL